MGSPNPATPDIACFQGTPYWDDVTGAWRCPDTATGTTRADRDPKRLPVQYGTTITVSNTPVNIFSVTSIVDWMRQHPYLTIGGLGVVGYLLYMFFSRRSRY